MQAGQKFRKHRVPDIGPSVVDSDPACYNIHMEKKNYRRADAKRLTELASLSLQKVGVSRDDADLTAAILVDADLRGIKTHGVMNLYSYYVKKVQDGIINGKPELSVERCTPTTALLDADNGLGFIASHRAMELAIEMAEEYGMGWVNVFNSNHNGAGSYYVNMAAEAGMLGMQFSTGGNSVAAPGGKGKLVGNNVLAFAAPAGKNPPFIFDMAPTMSIANKAHLMSWDGETMPEGYVIDGKGNPVTDPEGYFGPDSAVLPLGSSLSHGVHKGFGLLLMVDILAGMLSGDGGSMLRKKGVDTHSFFAMKIGCLEGGQFTTLMDEMIEKLHRSPVQEGISSVRYPGERAAQSVEERHKTGIPLHENIAKELEAMGESLGIPCDIWLD